MTHPLWPAESGRRPSVILSNVLRLDCEQAAETGDGPVLAVCIRRYAFDTFLDMALAGLARTLRPLLKVVYILRAVVHHMVGGLVGAARRLWDCAIEMSLTSPYKNRQACHPSVGADVPAV